MSHDQTSLFYVSRSPSDVATNAKQLRTFLEKGKTSLVDVDHKVRNRILTYVSKEKDVMVN